MEAQPWHFDRHILALCDLQGDLKPSEYQMHMVPFWARVYDLPILGGTTRLMREGLATS